MSVKKDIAFKARGVYIGGPEVACGNGPSYFADLNTASASFLNNLRNSTSETNSATVHMNYCIPWLVLSGNVTQPLQKQPQVSGYIKSSQNITNGLFVDYKAGTYIELNDGFNSGNNFIAEIDPCVSVISYIAYKTDDTEVAQQEENKLDIPTTNWIKIYPTILASGNSITIETMSAVDGVELMLFDIQGKHLQSYRLNRFEENTKTSVALTNLPSGLYFIKAHNGNNFLNQKIIIQ